MCFDSRYQTQAVHNPTLLTSYVNQRKLSFFFQKTLKYVIHEWCMVKMVLMLRNTYIITGVIINTWCFAQKAIVSSYLLFIIIIALKC